MGVRARSGTQPTRIRTTGPPARRQLNLATRKMFPFGSNNIPRGGKGREPRSAFGLSYAYDPASYALGAASCERRRASSEPASQRQIQLYTRASRLEPSRLALVVVLYDSRSRSMIRSYGARARRTNLRTPYERTSDARQRSSYGDADARDATGSRPSTHRVPPRGHIGALNGACERYLLFVDVIVAPYTCIQFCSARFA